MCSSCNSRRNGQPWEDRCWIPLLTPSVLNSWAQTSQSVAFNSGRGVIPVSVRTGLAGPSPQACDQHPQVAKRPSVWPHWFVVCVSPRAWTGNLIKVSLCALDCVYQLSFLANSNITAYHPRRPGLIPLRTSFTALQWSRIKQNVTRTGNRCVHCNASCTQIIFCFITGKSKQPTSIRAVTMDLSVTSAF